jgi:hypothetical protein
LDTSHCSRSIVVSQSAKLGAQYITVRWAQIDPVALGENVQQKNRDIVTAVKRYHAISTTFSLASPGKAHFPSAPCSRHDYAGIRGISQESDDLAYVMLGQTSFFRAQGNRVKAGKL